MPFSSITLATPAGMRQTFCYHFRANGAKASNVSALGLEKSSSVARGVAYLRWPAVAFRAFPLLPGRLPVASCCVPLLIMASRGLPLLPVCV